MLPAPPAPPPAACRPIKRLGNHYLARPCNFQKQNQPCPPPPVTLWNPHLVTYNIPGIPPLCRPRGATHSHILTKTDPHCHSHHNKQRVPSASSSFFFFFSFSHPSFGQSQNDAPRLSSLPLPREPLGPPGLHVALGEPAASLDELDDVDALLDGHDGEADARGDPRPEAVHLVGAGQLEGACAVRVGEEVLEQRRINLRALVDRLGCGRGHGLEEGRGEQGRGEGEEVEGDEERFV